MPDPVERLARGLALWAVLASAVACQSTPSSTFSDAITSGDGGVDSLPSDDGSGLPADAPPDIERDRGEGPKDAAADADAAALPPAQSADSARWRPATFYLVLLDRFDNG